MGAEDQTSNDLSRYLMVPVRRWRFVAAIVVITMAAILTYLTVGAKTYTASATVELQATTSTPFDTSKSPSQVIDMNSEAASAVSDVVMSNASKSLSAHPDPADLQANVQVGSATSGTTMTISYSASSASSASVGANAIAAAYLAFRGEQASEQKASLLGTLSTQVTKLREDLTKLNAAIATQVPTSAAAQNNLTLRTLLTQQIADLTQRQNQLLTVYVNPGRLVNKAVTAGAVVTPSRKLFLAGGLMVSLVLGGAAAFARERLDRRLRTASSFADLIEAPVITVDRDGPTPLRATVTTDESMYMLRTRVMHALRNSGSRVALVVDHSRTKESGITASRLAALMAQSGASVALVLISDGAAGLTSPTFRLLNSAESELDAVPTSGHRKLAGYTTPLVPSLTVVPLEEGPDADGARERKEIAAVLDKARRAGSLVVLATTGRPRRSSVFALAALADEVLVVAQARTTRRADIVETAQDIEGSGARVFGGVLIKRRRRRARRGDRRPADVTSTPDELELELEPSARGEETAGSPAALGRGLSNGDQVRGELDDGADKLRR